MRALSDFRFLLLLISYVWFKENKRFNIYFIQVIFDVMHNNKHVHYVKFNLP